MVRGYGLEQQELENHPDNGEQLLGLQLPHWDKILQICNTAAVLFPMLPYQHWDIALGVDGPVIIELNTYGSIDMVQYASGQGLYDTQLREFVARYSITARS